MNKVFCIAAAICLFSGYLSSGFAETVSLEQSVQMSLMLKSGQQAAISACQETAGNESPGGDSAYRQILAASRQIALDAVIAHLEVVRAREIVAVAEKRVGFYQELAGRLEPGADADSLPASLSDIAHLEGSRARLAAARVDLHIAAANYVQLTGLQSVDSLSVPIPQFSVNGSGDPFSAAQEQLTGMRASVVFIQEQLVDCVNAFQASEHSLTNLLNIASEYFHTNELLVDSLFNLAAGFYRDSGSELFCLLPQERDAADSAEFLRPLAGPVTFTSVATGLAGEAASLQTGAAGIDTAVDTIRMFLDAWVQAWQDQDVARYLSCYSDRFEPEGEQNFAGWKSSRQIFLTKPEYIRIFIDNLEVTPLADERYQVRFLQSYSSDLYHDQSQKRLVLVNEQGRWKIIHEISNPSTD